ncbi:MAG: MSMEG_1061 family FMN-dependent PPOX-type flavoprotein, partial [Pseudomonadota bacterium]
PIGAIATKGAEGMDCSPRGDGPGFVTILDDQTLAIPDRRGNNRLDTLRNIVEDPRVALLFLIPGWNECLRVNGRAIVTANEDLRARFERNGVLPATVVVITIETMYFQCARALKRAELWSAESHVKKGELPSTGTLIQSAVTEFDGKAYDEGLEERQMKTLY